MKNTYVKNTYEVIKVWSMGGGKKSDIILSSKAVLDKYKEYNNKR